MVYVTGSGDLSEKRSFYRNLTDFFWNIINIIGLFITTLVDPSRPVPKRIDSSTRDSQTYRNGNAINRHSGGASIRGMDSLRHRGGAAAGGG